MDIHVVEQIQTCYCGSTYYLDNQIARLISQAPLPDGAETEECAYCPALIVRREPGDVNPGGGGDKQSEADAPRCSWCVSGADVDAEGLPLFCSTECETAARRSAGLDS